MRIRHKKSKVMTVSRTPDPLDISINDLPLKQTCGFKYLGSIFIEDDKVVRERETGIPKANNVRLTPYTPQHPNQD